MAAWWRLFGKGLTAVGSASIVAEKIGHALRIPRLALQADSAKCTACGTCAKSCPMQLPVKDMVAAEKIRSTECFMCETCVDVCPSQAIRLGFRHPE